MNTAIIQGAQGLSFSVDVNTAKEIARQLIQEGKVFKAYLGIMLQEVELNSRIREHYNLINRKGLFITRIEENSPASRSQLMEGDIVISFNHKPINTSHDLFRELSKRSVLDMIDVTVIRHSEMLTLPVTPVVKT